MVSADRLPAVNRLAATLPARFPVVNCLAVISAPDFWLSIAFAATFVRPVFGGQSFCGGFCTGFLAADRLCSDFCSSGFWWSIVLRRFLHRIFGCGSPLKRLLPVRFRLSTVLQWVPHWILAVDRLCGDFRRPILAAWLPGPAVSFLPDPCGRCGSGALAAAACGSRFSGCRAPEFRPRIFRRLPQKMLSH